MELAWSVFYKKSKKKKYADTVLTILQVWKASDLRLYSTYVLSGPASSISLDPAERAIYLGTDTGDILHVDLYHSTNSGSGLEYTGGLQRVVDAGSADFPQFIGHSGKVLSLDVSFDGTLLVSGGEDGLTLVWDIASHQMMKKIGPARSTVFSILYLIVL